MELLTGKLFLLPNWVWVIAAALVIGIWAFRHFGTPALKTMVENRAAKKKAGEVQAVEQDINTTAGHMVIHAGQGSKLTGEKVEIDLKATGEMQVSSLDEATNHLATFHGWFLPVEAGIRLWHPVGSIELNFDKATRRLTGVLPPNATKSEGQELHLRQLTQTRPEEPKVEVEKAGATSE